MNQRTLRLHYTTRRFLQDQAGKEGRVAQQKRFLSALDEVSGSDRPDAPTRRYYYLHLPYHLAEANERQRLDSLLLDPSWLAAKVAATNTAALVADYDHYALGEPQQLIGRTLWLASESAAYSQHSRHAHRTAAVHVANLQR